VRLEVTDQSGEFGGRRSLPIEGEKALKEIDGREQAAVLRLARATPLDDRRAVPSNRTGWPPTADRRRLRLRRRVRRAGALACDDLFQGVQEPRLAQSRLADEEHDLARALLSPFPAIFEQADLVIAPGQRRQADGQSDVDGRARTALTRYAVDRDRLR